MARPVENCVDLKESTKPYCHVTIDLEDYKHATMLDMGLSPLTNSEQVRRGLTAILDCIAATAGDRHVTLFSTGQIARDQPELLQMLAADGHEIGCHSDAHENIWDLNVAEFEANLRKAVAVLEQVSGQPIRGFRAPNFSVDQRCPWVFEVLAANGFAYDSSLVGASREAAALPYDCVYRGGGRTLAEFPIFAQRVAGERAIRVIGGTYFRLLPLSIIRSLLRRAWTHGFTPIVYLHPADLDPDFEPVTWREMAALGKRSQLFWALRQKQWATNADAAAKKLRDVLKIFPHRGPLYKILDGDGAVAA